jgi:hypothetical protein
MRIEDIGYMGSTTKSDGQGYWYQVTTPYKCPECGLEFDYIEETTISYEYNKELIE